MTPDLRQGRLTRFEDDREPDAEKLDQDSDEVRFPQLVIPGADVHPSPQAGPEPRDEYELRPEPGERY